MDSEKLPEEYLDWIEAEKKIADEAYLILKAQGSGHRTQGAGHRAQVGQKDKGLRKKVIQRSLLVRVAAAAVLVLAIGTLMWIKRDIIFKSTPDYTEEQIALSYDQAVRALAVCANSLSVEMDKLQNLNQIPESLDNLKKLGNVINN